MSYYTASFLLAHRPQQMGRIYDNGWFMAQMPGLGIHGVRDIFNVQPPTMSLMLLPAAALPVLLARVAWLLLNIILLGGGLVVLVRLLELPLRFAAWLFPACLFFTPVVENLKRGQAYVLLFFLFCLAWRALLQSVSGNRQWCNDAGAGIALGLMLILKAAGLWLWPLLLLAGRWRVLVWAVAAASLLAALSLPRIGITPWLIYLSLIPGIFTSPAHFSTPYQTVSALFGHLLIGHPRWNPSPVANLPWLGHSLAAGTLLAALVVSAHQARLDPAARGDRRLTLAVFTALLPCMAPVAQGYHYALVLPSLITAGWWAWRTQPGRQALGILVVAALLLGSPLPYTSARLDVGWAALMAYPRLYGAFILWGWLLWARRFEAGQATSD